jgi:hypothetical protein
LAVQTPANSTRRALRQQVLPSGLQGAVVAWGSLSVDQANVPLDIKLEPPCLEGTGMCLQQQDALTHSTAYKALFVLTDAFGNQMQEPVVAIATTNPDYQPPKLQLRLGSAARGTVGCETGPGLNSCGTVGPNNVSLHFDVDEAGAVYYLLTKLPPSAQCDCEALQVAPGVVYEVPEGQSWSGCKRTPQGRRRQLLDTHNVRTPHPNTGVSEPQVASNAFDDWWAEPGSRALQQATDYNAADVCLVNKQCGCCTPNRNCHLDFDDVWTSRADLGAAGTRLMSACAYMQASKLIRMPISDVWDFAALADTPVLPQSVGSTGPAAPARRDSEVSGPDSRKSGAPERNVTREGSLALKNEASTAEAAAASSESAEIVLDAPDKSAQIGAHALTGRHLTAGTERVLVMAVEPGDSIGNSSSASFRHPPFAAAQGRRLEPDSFYALFAVTEDQIYPNPNLPSIARQWIMHTQAVVPPSCEVECLEQHSTQTSIQFRVKLNTTGRVFYVIQEESGHATPTVQNVRSCLFLIACMRYLVPTSIADRSVQANCSVSYSFACIACQAQTV